MISDLEGLSFQVTSAYAADNTAAVILSIPSGPAVSVQAQVHRVKCLKSAETILPSGSKAQVPDTTYLTLAFPCLDRQPDCF